MSQMIEFLDPLPIGDVEFLKPYLPVTTCGTRGPSSPPPSSSSSSPPPYNPHRDGLPFVTLTYATSLDSHISLAPGVQTPLSGPLSKRLTHTLRSHHHGILVGAGTAVADDPGLNCRIDIMRLESGSGQPRPIIIDPRGRWLSKLDKDARVLRTQRNGAGLGPWVYISSLTDGDWADDAERLLEEHGGKLVRMRPDRDLEADIKESDGRCEHFSFSWLHLLRDLYASGLQSVMVEGGATVINTLLKGDNTRFVNSVIITMAPLYLGNGGLHVSPEARTSEASGKPTAAVAFKDVKWTQLGDDVIFTGRIK